MMTIITFECSYSGEAYGWHNGDRITQITGEDGLRAMIIAVAANQSVKEQRPVKITEIG